MEFNVTLKANEILQMARVSANKLVREHFSYIKDIYSSEDSELDGTLSTHDVAGHTVWVITDVNGDTTVLLPEDC